MARNDGIDRTSARNVDVPDKDIDNTQKHNERETRILSRNVSAITSTSKTQPPAIRNCLLRWNPPV